MVDSCQLLAGIKHCIFDSRTICISTITEAGLFRFFFTCHIYIFRIFIRRSFIF